MRRLAADDLHRRATWYSRAFPARELAPAVHNMAFAEQLRHAVCEWRTSVEYQQLVLFMSVTWLSSSHMAVDDKLRHVVCSDGTSQCQSAVMSLDLVLICTAFIYFSNGCVTKIESMQATS